MSYEWSAANGEIINREIKSHGITVLRYRIMRLRAPENPSIDEFLCKFCDTLIEYAEKTGEELAQTLGSADRAGRAAFRELMIRVLMRETYRDEVYKSVVCDFIAEDKEKIRRSLRLGFTFERDSGRLCTLSRFLRPKERRRYKNAEFYLSGNHVILVENCFGREEIPKSSRKMRAEDFIKESSLTRKIHKKEN